MSKIAIRQCRREDENGILNVCYRTGFMGEDLTGTSRFDDVKLFGYLFCLYYPRYESRNCFIAIAEDNCNMIVGYILGTDNSRMQKILSAILMGWRIVLRLFLYTRVNFPESFRAVLYFIRNFNIKDGPKNLYRDYPAHLHINILPEYQHMGIGSMLIKKFEEHNREMNITGIHLKTSNKNIKAIPFYLKKGYELIYEIEGNLWEGVSSYKTLIFAKKLN